MSGQQNETSFDNPVILKLTIRASPHTPSCKTRKFRNLQVTEVFGM